MTREEIESMLNETEISYEYNHFEVEDAIPPPFICYLTPESHNFAADGIVYQRINELDIELYTDQKEEALEKRIEDVLNSHEIFWEKTEGYIESEQMYEVLYEMEVI